MFTHRIEKNSLATFRSALGETVVRDGDTTANPGHPMHLTYRLIQSFVSPGYLDVLGPQERRNRIKTSILEGQFYGIAMDESNPIKDVRITGEPESRAGCHSVGMEVDSDNSPVHRS